MFQPQRVTFEELSERLRAYEHKYGYFAAMERGLRQNIQGGTVEVPIICLASDDYNGLIRCRVSFGDGSVLTIPRS